MLLTVVVAVPTAGAGAGGHVAGPMALRGERTVSKPGRRRVPVRVADSRRDALADARGTGGAAECTACRRHVDRRLSAAIALDQWWFDAIDSQGLRAYRQSAFGGRNSTKCFRDITPAMLDDRHADDLRLAIPDGSVALVSQLFGRRRDILAVIAPSADFAASPIARVALSRVDDRGRRPSRVAFSFCRLIQPFAADVCLNRIRSTLPAMPTLLLRGR